MVYKVIFWSGKREHKTFSDYKELGAYWHEHAGDIKQLKRVI